MASEHGPVRHHLQVEDGNAGASTAHESAWPVATPEQRAGCPRWTLQFAARRGQDGMLDDEANASERGESKWRSGASRHRQDEQGWETDGPEVRLRVGACEQVVAPLAGRREEGMRSQTLLWSFPHCDGAAGHSFCSAHAGS